MTGNRGCLGFAGLVLLGGIAMALDLVPVERSCRGFFMKLYELAEISLQVTRNASRLAKIGHLAECLRRLEPGEIPIAVAYLCGELPQGKIGIGWSMLKDTLAGPASGSPALTLAETDACFETVRQTTGSGSSRRRSELFAALMARASETERDFLRRLVLGEMRHGALEGVMMEAVAKSIGTGVPRGAPGLLRHRFPGTRGDGCPDPG